MAESRLAQVRKLGAKNRMAQPQISLLITDLDDTLWDWFTAWRASFGGMLDELVRETAIRKEVLIPEIREVHRSRGTAEYAQLLDELPCLLDRYERPSLELPEVMHAFYSGRLHNTHLHPGVLDTLQAVRAAGVPVIGYTESLYYATVWRTRHTELDGLLDVLFTSPDHDFPTGIDKRSLRTRPDDEYELAVTTHKVVPRGIEKPNVQVLASIIEAHNVEPEHVVYVGDNLMKDVAMAQSIGVRDVHAKYGEASGRPGYNLLREVSHWSDAQIERERLLTTAAGDVHPSYSLLDGFDELLDRFQFRR